MARPQNLSPVSFLERKREAATHQAEVTDLLEWNLLGRVEPVPSFARRARGLVLSVEVYSLFSSFVDVLINVVAPKCVRTCTRPT